MALTAVTLNTSPSFTQVTLNTSPSFTQVTLNTSPSFTGVTLNTSPSFTAVALNTSPSFILSGSFLDASNNWENETPSWRICSRSPAEFWLSYLGGIRRLRC